MANGNQKFKKGQTISFDEAFGASTGGATGSQQFQTGQTLSAEEAFGGGQLQRVEPTNLRDQRIEQGLPVGLGERAKPTFVGGALRDITRPFARVAATIRRPFVGELGSGAATLEEATLKAPLLGGVRPIPGPLDRAPEGKPGFLGTGQAGPGQAIGTGLEIGATLAPGGGAAKGARAGLTPAKTAVGRAAQRVTPFAKGQVVAGGAAGAGIELQEGDAGVGEVLGAGTLGAGLGGVLGSRLPGRAIRGAGRTAGSALEAILGKTTGTSDDVIREAGNIVREGGERQQAFVDALRGKITADEIVADARTGLGTLKTARRESFQNRLSQLNQEQPLNIQPIREVFDGALEKFGINVGPGGVIDFRGARVANQKDREIIQNVVDELRLFGDKVGDNKLQSVDELRFFLQEAFTKGTKSGAFVDTIRKKVRQELGDQVEGFDVMQKGFAESTAFIKEIEQVLSLGDRSSRDTAFKKLVGSLKNNNEIRQQVVRELEGATGVQLTGRIVGQQLSEKLSRGLMGALGSSALVGLTAAGQLAPAFLVSLIGLSPRLIGEAINALGLPLRVRREITRIITSISSAIGERAIGELRKQAELGVIRSTQ